MTSHEHHDVVKLLAREIGHGGVRSRVADRKQQEQLLVGWAAEEDAELRPTV